MHGLRKLVVSRQQCRPDSAQVVILRDQVPALFFYFFFLMTELEKVLARLAKQALLRHAGEDRKALRLGAQRNRQVARKRATAKLVFKLAFRQRPVGDFHASREETPHELVVGIRKRDLECPDQLFLRVQFRRAILFPSLVGIPRNHPGIAVALRGKVLAPECTACPWDEREQCAPEEQVMPEEHVVEERSPRAARPFRQHLSCYRHFRIRRHLPPGLSGWKGPPSGRRPP